MENRLGLALVLLVVSSLCAGRAGASHGPVPAPAPGPGRTAVVLAISPGSGADVTRVVRAHGTSWFAAATNGTVHIYRWAGAAWREVGHVDGPLPGSGGDSGLGKPAFLTGSGAPDFPVLAGGADTQWFSVVARIDGRWQAARFDYGDGTTDAIDARGVSRHLVHAQMNACGCAAGPESYTWLRFDGKLFVPTTPPGPAPACTPRALGAAGRIVGGSPSDPTLRHLGQPFSVSRLACADGWALASGTRQGAHELALFEQHGRRWLEAAVAPAKVIERGVALAIPHSVLSSLGSRIGKRFPVRRGHHRHVSWSSDAPPQSGAAPTPATTPVGVAVRPGSIYRNSWSSCCGPISRRWFAVTILPRQSSARARIHVLIYRWRHKGWARQADVPVEFAPAHREGPVTELTESPLAGSKPRGFELQTDAWPGWTAEIARVGGRWRVVPFEVGHARRAAVEGMTFSGSPVTGPPKYVYSPGRTELTAYAYRGGVFAAAWRRPFPPCTPRSLERHVKPGVHLGRSACSYGFALATGTKNGRPVEIAFGDVDGRGWRWASTVPRRRADLLGGSAPGWILRIVERRLSAG